MKRLALFVLYMIDDYWKLTFDRNLAGKLLVTPWYLLAMPAVLAIFVVMAVDYATTNKNPPLFEDWLKKRNVRVKKAVAKNLSL